MKMQHRQIHVNKNVTHSRERYQRLVTSAYASPMRAATCCLGCLRCTRSKGSPRSYLPQTAKSSHRTYTKFGRVSFEAGAAAAEATKTHKTVDHRPGRVDDASILEGCHAAKLLSSVRLSRGTQWSCRSCSIGCDYLVRIVVCEPEEVD